MNKNLHIILLIIMSLIVINSYSHNSFTAKIKSFFPTHAIEKVEQNEIPIDTINSLSLDNDNGSITIKTGPKKSIFLRATKHAHKNMIDDLAIHTQTINNTHLAITTTNTTKKKKGAVNYELIIPESLNIAINISEKGSVFIKDVQGSIDVMACDNITLINSKKFASLQTIKKGSIFITNAQGPIEAYTQKGAIVAEDITHNFDGRSIKGKINISYKKLPSTSSINLATTSGNITLALPIQSNAAICGNTLYGTLMSDHEIMLNAHTTKLDKNAWAYFTKHVEGILGNGKDALIHISSVKGNVKIVETMVT